MHYLVQLLIPLGLLLVGFWFGSRNEKKHFQSIIDREEKYASIETTNLKRVAVDDALIAESKLLMGSTVVSIDYFKRILSSLRGIFGGNLTSYESLVDRARREALLGLKKAGSDCDLIVNLRIETSSIDRRANQKGSIGSIEVLAYATGIKLKA